MAQQTRATIKSYFETGDIPTEQQYVHLIDSYTALTHTDNSGSLTLSGSLILTGSLIGTFPIETTGNLTLTGNTSITGHITASGNISSSGNLMGVSASLDYVETTGNISASDNIYATGYHIGDRKLAFASATDDKGISLGNGGDGNLELTHITASGNISSSLISTASLGRVNSTTIGINDSNFHLYGTSNTQRISGSTKMVIASSKVELSTNNMNTAGQSAYLLVNGDTSITGNITSSGNISASGEIKGTRLYVQDLPIAKNSDGNFTLGTEGLYAGSNITASGNISSSGEVRFKTLNYDGTPIIANAEEINFLDGVLSDVDKAFDTAQNLSQGTVRFTGLDNVTSTLALTELTPAATPAFKGIRLDHDDVTESGSYGDTFSTQGPTFNFHVNSIPDLNASTSGKIIWTTTRINILNDSILDFSICYCNVHAHPLQAATSNIKNGTFDIYLANMNTSNWTVGSASISCVVF
tara:strand:+ start:3570 stop:4982 length:1413 start_codon:yes stop_codon:yes gene_type:complete